MYSAVSISAVQQSDSFIHMCIHALLFYLLFHMAYPRIVNTVPWAIQ